MKPTIVTLCGSTRFKDAFQKAMLDETLAGKIVLTVGCMTHSDTQLNITEEQKWNLDRLHMCKIALSDEILVLNVGGYVGESTSREIAYAYKIMKKIRWLESKETFREDILQAESHYIKWMRNPIFLELTEQ